MKTTEIKMIIWYSACHQYEKTSNDTDDILLKPFPAVITVITGKIEVMTMGNGGKHSLIRKLHRLSSLSSLSSLEIGISAEA